MYRPAHENFDAVRRLYDVEMAANATSHDLVFPHVFGPEEYVGQFSDNCATELVAMGQAMELPEGAHVLDIGCGRGAVARLLATRLGLRVTGIDLSAVPLRVARAEEIAGANVTYIHGDVHEHVFSDPFDGIYGTGAFCHFEAARLFARCRTLLRPDGTLAFMERIRLGDIGPVDWTRLTSEWHCPFVYSVDEYSALLREAGFTLRTVADRTPSFRVWQRRSVEVRRQLEREIVELTSREHFETSLRFAAYENDVTEAGKLGYALIVAQRGRSGA
ncbi:class I SAM-dependent methyltransferase [Sorangium sp. So ce260]|uniref:SAM-dependent methyltransferase n=1 Tax=Sorangium sp. So ce260 TaxID=3133291 RepID=UPI003F5DA503